MSRGWAPPSATLGFSARRVPFPRLAIGRRPAARPSTARSAAPHPLAPRPAAPRGVRALAAALALALAAVLVPGSGEAAALYPLNDTLAAPVVRLSGGPLIFSDDPEYVPAAGITYRDLLRRPGWFRIFDYHTNLSGQRLYMGFALVNRGSRPVTVGLGRHAQGVSGAIVWTGQHVFLYWLASARPGQVVARYPLAPGTLRVWAQRVPAVPAGSVLAEMQYDLDLLSRGVTTAPELEVDTFAAPALPRTVDDLARLAVLPPRPGAVRGTYPHDEARLTLALPAGRSTAVGLFNVSGPATGYTAPDDALPGESMRGWDAVDRRPVWSKGPYGVDYQLRVLPPAGASSVTLSVTTTRLTQEGLPHAGDGYVLTLDGTAHVLNGAYLPALAAVGGFRGTGAVDTTLPGGSSAPQFFVFAPSGGHGQAPPETAGAAVELYGWPSTAPSRLRWLRVPLPAAGPAELRLSLQAPTQAPEGFAPRFLVMSGGRRLGPPYRVTGGDLWVAATAPAVVPFALLGADGAPVERGALHFRAWLPVPRPVGAYGATLFWDGYGLVVPPGALAGPQPVLVGMAGASGTPPPPPGWSALEPPFSVTASPAVRPARPLILDADDRTAVDHAMAFLTPVRVWRLRGQRWVALPPATGATAWDGGFDTSFLLPGFGTYLLTTPAAPR